MYQKDLVRKAWADAGLYSTNDAKLRQFLTHVDQAPMECWSELVDLVRTQYHEYLEKLAMPIWNTGDTLLRLNLIRNAVLERPDELKFVQKLVRRLRMEGDELELQAVIHVAPLEVLDAIDRRKGLPNNLRTLVEMRRGRLVSSKTPTREGEVPA